MVDYNYVRYDTSMYKTKSVTRYAIRNKETKERVSYRFANYRDALDKLKRLWYHDTNEYEIYRTSQRLVTMR